MGDFCSLSSGVKVWCTSDDFVNDIVTIVPAGMEDPKTHLISGDVVMEDYTALGSNTVVMPDNYIPPGTVVGALSFVPPRYKFDEWAVYAGNPLRYIRPRNRENVLAQAAKLAQYLTSRTPE